MWRHLTLVRAHPDTRLNLSSDGRGMIGCGDVSHTCGLVILLVKDGHRYDAVFLLAIDLGEGLMLPAYLTSPKL